MNNEFVIGTFNVKNDYKKRKPNYINKIEVLTKYIYDNNVYCLGLQEITNKYSIILKNLITKDYSIYGNYRFKNLKLVEKLNESTKILSKCKVKNSNTIYLSKFPFFPRIMTTLETADFLFINVHLEFWSKYFRKKELNNLYNYIESNKEKNIILVGDFNTEYNDKHLFKFIDKLSKIGINLVNNNNNTYEHKIIDFVFVCNKYKILNVWVKEIPKEVSDHNLLLVRIKKSKIKYIN